ncbi:hypothetical protein DSM3645_05884, partial [Blastopirellula marina DSM 3645]
PFFRRRTDIADRERYNRSIDDETVFGKQSNVNRL